MVQHGIAEASCSPWSFPCLLADKSNGEDRFCTDFRKVNSVKKQKRFLHLLHVMTSLNGLMAFGMRNAPATFQRLINVGLPFCEAYLDDLVVCSESW